MSLVPPPSDDIQLEYDPHTRRLSVTFATSGETFAYRRVPRTVYDAFARASSKRRFYAVHIRPRYARIRTVQGNRLEGVPPGAPRRFASS
jgi:hypothetical protein